jgi:hypothetical protein
MIHKASLDIDGVPFRAFASQVRLIARRYIRVIKPDIDAQYNISLSDASIEQICWFAASEAERITFKARSAVDVSIIARRAIDIYGEMEYGDDILLEYALWRTVHPPLTAREVELTK